MDFDDERHLGISGVELCPSVDRTDGGVLIDVRG